MARDLWSERTRLVARIVVSGAALAAALPMILGDRADAPREWAFVVVLFVINYWLR